ncbi:lactate racemase domain-containing protein [Bdellovibrionota bacterium]
MDTTRLPPRKTPSVVEKPSREPSLRLGYGEIPSKYLSRISEVIRPQLGPEVTSLSDTLDEALMGPVGQLRLQDFIEPHHKIAVVVSDKARRIPRKEMLDALHRELPHAPYSQFKMVIANGTHEPSKPEELELPQEVIDRYEWVSHKATRWRDLRLLGKTPLKLKQFFLKILIPEIKKTWEDRKRSIKRWWEAIRTGDINEIKNLLLFLLPVRLAIFFTSGLGMPLFVNKAILKADWIVCLGQIQPHYFVGFSGGIKSIFPGVAAKFSIAFNHFMKIHNTARIGRTEGNIVREDLESTTKFLKNITILNVVSGPKGKIFGAVSGDPILAHREGVKTCKQVALGPFKNRADIVVVSAGNPMGKSMYQFAKALVPAGMVVKPGGTIICSGSCKDGIGGSRLILNHIVFRNGIQNYLPPNTKIRLVSEAQKEEVKKTYFSYDPSLDVALEKAFEKHGSNAKFTVIPEAAYLFVSQEATH